MTKENKNYKGTNKSEKWWDEAWERHEFNTKKIWFVTLQLPEYVPFDGRLVLLNYCRIIIRLPFKNFVFTFNNPKWLKAKNNYSFIKTKNDCK